MQEENVAGLSAPPDGKCLPTIGKTGRDSLVPRPYTKKVLRKGARSFPYEIRRETMRMYCDGFGLPAIVTKTGVAKPTIIAWARLMGLEKNSRISEDDLDLMLGDWSIRYASGGDAPRAGKNMPVIRNGLMVNSLHGNSRNVKTAIMLTGHLDDVIATVRAAVIKRMDAEDTIEGMLKAGTALAMLGAWESSMMALPQVERWTDVKTMREELFNMLDIHDKGGKDKSKRQGIDIRILNSRRDGGGAPTVEATVVDIEEGMG